MSDQQQIQQQTPPDQGPTSQEIPAPPDYLKPWYYQYWFLYPVIVFWPVWAVLIIRSPWHNRLVVRAVAWAMLIVGGYLIGWRQIYLARELNQFTTTIIIPGLLLTVITQALWIRDRKKVRQMSEETEPSPAPAATERSRRARNRRRGQRSGRSNRGR